MYEIRGLIHQDIKLLFTNMMWMFYNTAFPFLLIAIMGSLCADLFGSDVRAYDYYGVAFLIYSGVNAATIASNSFMEEKIKAGNMRVLYAPIQHEWLYLSKIIASTLFCFICHVLVGIACVVLFHMQTGTMWWLLLVLLFLTELFASILGIFFCLLFRSENAANQVLTIFINLSALLGGIFIAMERFGDLLSAISWFSPMKWLLQASFLCIYDHEIIGVLYAAAGLVVLCIMLLMVCRHIFEEEACIC